MKIAGLSLIVLRVIKVICILSKTIPSPGRQTCASMEFFVGNNRMLVIHLCYCYTLSGFITALLWHKWVPVNRNNYL